MAPKMRGNVDRLTAIFTKRPMAGEVKTRLCPPLSPGEAARLAEAMLADAVRHGSGCAGSRTAICFAPGSEGPWFASRFPEVTDRRPQEGADLAARLGSFFRAELARRPAGSTVVLGSDVPVVGPRELVAAHEALEEGADLVLGPDGGGGYYLIGLRSFRAELFTEVEMSTPDMYARTVALAERLGMAVRELPEGLDVDTESDLLRLRAWIESSDEAETSFPTETARFLRTLIP